MPKTDFRQAIDLAASEVGGDEEFRRALIAIALHESGGDPTAHGDNGKSIGLFQANRAGGRGAGYSVAQLEDPVFNSRLAAQKLLPYYNEAKRRGLQGADVAVFMSRYGQRPKAGAWEGVRKFYGESPRVNASPEPPSANPTSVDAEQEWQAYLKGQSDIPVATSNVETTDVATSNPPTIASAQPANPLILQQLGGDVPEISQHIIPQVPTAPPAPPPLASASAQGVVMPPRRAVIPPVAQVAAPRAQYSKSGEPLIFNRQYNAVPARDATAQISPSPVAPPAFTRVPNRGPVVESTAPSEPVARYDAGVGIAKGGPVPLPYAYVAKTQPKGTKQIIAEFDQSVIKDKVQAAIKSGQIEQGDVTPEGKDTPTESLERLGYRNEFRDLKRVPRRKGTYYINGEWVKDPQMTEDEYVNQRQRASVRSSLKQEGIIGQVLAAAVNPRIDDPGDDLATLGGLDFANSLTGQALSAIDPKSFENAAEELGRGKGSLAVGVSRTLGSVTGMLANLALTKNIMPVATPTANAVKQALSIQGPAELIAVAKGDKSLEQAAAETAITAGSFRSIPAIIEQAGMIGDEVAAATFGKNQPLSKTIGIARVTKALEKGKSVPGLYEQPIGEVVQGQAERLIAKPAAEVANAIGQAGAGAATEFLQTGQLSPENALLNVALSHGEAARGREVSRPVEPLPRESAMGAGSPSAVEEAPARIIEPQPQEVQNAVTTGQEPTSYIEEPARVEPGTEPRQERPQIRQEESAPDRRSNRSEPQPQKQVAISENSTYKEVKNEAIRHGVENPDAYTKDQLLKKMSVAPEQQARTPAPEPPKTTTSRDAIIAALPVNEASTGKAIRDYAIQHRVMFKEHESWNNILKAIREDAVAKAEAKAEPAAAGSGGPMRSPRDVSGRSPVRPEPPTPAPAAEERLPLFKEGQRVYTYEPVQDASGKFIVPDDMKPKVGRVFTRDVIKRDAAGQIMRDESGNALVEPMQFIKVEGGGKAVPVDKWTTPEGVGHELTKLPDSDVPMSNYLVNKIAEEIAANTDVELTQRVRKNMKHNATFVATPDESQVKATISYHRNLAVDPNRSASEVKHDIGHFADYAAGDVMTLERGNVLGHVYALKNFTDATLGGVKNTEVRNEMRNLSLQWKPIKPDAPKSYVEYRMSSKEIAADYVSAMLNAPEFVQKVAPQSYKLWTEFLKARPEMKASYDRLSGLLKNEPGAIADMVLDEQLAKVKADPERRMANIIAEQERSKELKKRNSAYTGAVQLTGSLTAPLEHIGGQIERRVNKELKGVGLSKGIKEGGEYWRYIDAKQNGTETTYLKQFSPAQQAALENAYKEMGGFRTRSDVKIFGEALHRVSSMQEGMAYDLMTEVLAPLKQAGEDLPAYAAAYMENTAIAGPYRPEAEGAWGELGFRAGRFNPGHEGVQEARMALDRMRERIGDEKFAQVEASVKTLRDIHWDLMKELGNLGRFSPEFMQAAALNRDTYGRFAAIEYAGDQVRLAHQAMKGMVGDNADVMLTTMMQTLHLVKEIETQKAALAIKRAMENEAPYAWRKYDGKEKYDRRYEGIVSVWKNGQQSQYITDKSIAKAFAMPKQDMGSWQAAAEVIKNVQRDIFITYNPFFPTRNVPRDMANYIKVMGFRDIGQLFKNLGEAYRLGQNKYSALGLEALEHGALRLYNTSMRQDITPAPSKILLKEFGVVKPPKKGVMATLGRIHEAANKAVTTVPNPLSIVPRRVQEALESLPKLTGYKVLRDRGYSPEEAAYLSAKLGTPDTRIQGQITPILNDLFLFSNVNIQGQRRNIELLANPATRSGYLMRSLIYGVGAKLPQWLAKYGVASMLFKELFGKGSEEHRWIQEVERKYQFLSSDDINRYYVFPATYAKDARGNKEVRAFNYPVEEMDVLLGSLVEPIIKAAAGKTDNFSDFVDEYLRVGQAQLPNMQPLASLGFDFASYIMMGNWYDAYRKQYGLSEQEEAIAKNDKFAGRPMERFLEHALNSLFGTTARAVQNAVRRAAGDETANLRAPFFIQTKAGQYEAKRGMRTDVEAAAAQKSFEKDQMIEEARGGNFKALDDAFDQGLLSKQEYKSALQRSSMSEYEWNLRHTPEAQLQRNLDYYEEIGDSKKAEEIRDVLSGRGRKRKGRIVLMPH